MHLPVEQSLAESQDSPIHFPSSWTLPQETGPVLVDLATFQAWIARQSDHPELDVPNRWELTLGSTSRT
jgi:hypothetical protein